jgi:hypothetical protein
MNLPKILSISFGTLHFAIVGVPFILLNGNGEGLWYTLFIDYPLLLIGDFIFPRFMYGSIFGAFIVFVIGGTVMYASIGYFLGKSIKKPNHKMKTDR